jgi:DNA-binding LytR/AlgR family response regulator
MLRQNEGRDITFGTKAPGHVFSTSSHERLTVWFSTIINKQPRPSRNITLKTATTTPSAFLQVSGRLLRAAAAFQASAMHRWSPTSARLTGGPQNLSTAESGAADSQPLDAQTPGGGFGPPRSTPLVELAPPPTTLEHLAVESNGRCIFVRIGDIDWIAAADNYVELYVGPRSHLLRETMNGLESRLAVEAFVRISRATMVNFDRIKELKLLPRKTGEVILVNGTRLVLTRSYRDRLQRFGLR